jgi:glucose-1-phosphate cytidylyltransferase
VSLLEDGQVVGLEPIGDSNIWINGGFFVFKKEIFDYMNAGEELVHEPFHRLIAERQIIAYKHRGFWACVDTLKEKKMFDDLYARGETPWAVWEPSVKENKTKLLCQNNLHVDHDLVKTG